MSSTDDDRSKKLAELDKLFQDVREFRETDKYMRMLEFVSKFPDIAPFNLMLLYFQKPGCRYVASVHDWMVLYGRRPKVGARPLVILRTRGPVEFVYDLDDTEIDEEINPHRIDFPQELTQPFKAEGNVSVQQYNRMVNAMQAEGITYHEVDYGQDSAGAVGRMKSSHTYRTPKRILTYNTYFEMAINKNLDITTKATTVFHELGHVFCGHQHTPETWWLPQRGKLSRQVMEFEAESVCYLVCKRMGIKNPSAAYLHEYCDKHDETPEISSDAVLKAVNIVQKLVDGSHGLVPRDELITKSQAIKS